MSLIEEISRLQEKNDEIKSQAAELSEDHKEVTRSKLATTFTRYYFGILILIIVGIPLYNVLIFSITNQQSLVISLKDAILTYSAVTGSTFGLVVAYYFQSKENR